MAILDDLMSILNFDAVVKDIRRGIFHTGVLTRNCGFGCNASAGCPPAGTSDDKGTRVFIGQRPSGTGPVGLSPGASLRRLSVWPPSTPSWK